MLFVILAYYVIFAAIMFILVKFAPEGYETETGFHYIKNRGNHGKEISN